MRHSGSSAERVTSADPGSEATVSGSRVIDRLVFWLLFFALAALSTRLEVYARP